LGSKLSLLPFLFESLG